MFTHLYVLCRMGLQYVLNSMLFPLRVVDYIDINVSGLVAMCYLCITECTAVMCMCKSLFPISHI